MIVYASSLSFRVEMQKINTTNSWQSPTSVQEESPDSSDGVAGCTKRPTNTLSLSQNFPAKRSLTEITSNFGKQAHFVACFRQRLPKHSRAKGVAFPSGRGADTRGVVARGGVAP